jgi:hypothetical protein
MNAADEPAPVEIIGEERRDEQLRAAIAKKAPPTGARTPSREEKGGRARGRGRGEPPSRLAFDSHLFFRFGDQLRLSVPSARRSPRGGRLRACLREEDECAICRSQSLHETLDLPLLLVQTVK